MLRQRKPEGPVSLPRRFARLSVFAPAAIALLAFSFAVAAPLAPQAPAAAPGLVTRLVAEFSERETSLARLLATGDETAVLGLVEQDFELVASTNLQQFTPFDQFVAESAKKPQRVLSMRDLSVRELGTTALVSFYWDEKLPFPRDTVTWVVVDAWISGLDGWKLKTRFISGLGPSDMTPPGYVSQGPQIPKHY